jgi:hypothetical protein
MVNALQKSAIGSKFSVGALNRGTVMDNVMPHRSDSCFNSHFYQIDIKDAYENVNLEQLAEVISKSDESLGSKEEVLGFLQQYCSGQRGGLATGAPASPALFDFYCMSAIDNSWITKKTGLAYTRYLDDITISSQAPIPSVLRERIRTVVTDAGFQINHQKSRVLDRRKGPVTITGVTITPDGKLRPADAFIVSLSGLLQTPAVYMTEKQVQTLIGMNGFLSLFSKFSEEATYSYDWLTDQTMHLIDSASRRIELLAQHKKLPKSTKPERRRFTAEDLDEIRASVPLEKLIASTMLLKKAGREYKGLCPFHNEKTPSFTVSPEKGFYHCFGCSAHGDAIRWMTDQRGFSFPEAIRRLWAEYVQ